MINGSFEQGWETLPDKNQRPKEWELSYLPNGASLLAPKAGNGDAVHIVECRPECVHKLSVQLPPDEQLGGKDALILDGDAAYKVFGNSSFRATLEQEFTVEPGSNCSIVVPVQVHGHYNPDTGELYNVDTGAGYWRVVANDIPNTWNTFNNDFKDREWLVDGYSFFSPFGYVGIRIEFECHTLGGLDFFIDNLQFTSEQLQPSECPKPRAGWESRTTVLVRADAPDDVWLAACKWANDPTRRHSVDKSWDHAFYAPGLYVRIILWVDKPHVFSLTELMDFGDEYYGDIAWHIEAYLPYDQGGDPTPLPPVEPPTGNVPQPIVHYSGNFIGLQHAFTKDGWLEYIQQARPTVTKLFSCGDAITAKRAQPQMLSVWRKHVSDDGGWLIGDRIANAKRLAGLYDAELTTTCNNLGITRAEALKWIDVIESLNETVPSNNAQHINAAVEFDVAFSECVYQLFGGAVKAGIMNVAVGNPLESEAELLLPCARESHEGRAILGYHGYWAANKTQSYLDYAWEWHAGRWQEWDIIFTQHNLYPTYYLGECGICHSPDGQWFIPTEGWKTCGDFPNYIKQIIDFNDLLADWNEWNQGRCYGGTLFLYGGWGWQSFDFEPGDLALLREAMKVYA